MAFLALFCLVSVAGLTALALLLLRRLRCGSCGRLPLASRFDSGWPDLDPGFCPYCGAPRGD